MEELVRQGKCPLPNRTGKQKSCSEMKDYHDWQVNLHWFANCC